MLRWALWAAAVACAAAAEQIGVLSPDGTLNLAPKVLEELRGRKCCIRVLGMATFGVGGDDAAAVQAALAGGGRKTDYPPAGSLQLSEAGRAADGCCLILLSAVGSEDGDEVYHQLFWPLTQVAQHVVATVSWALSQDRWVQYLDNAVDRAHHELGFIRGTKRHLPPMTVAVFGSDEKAELLFGPRFKTTTDSPSLWKNKVEDMKTVGIEQVESAGEALAAARLAAGKGSSWESGAALAEHLQQLASRRLDVEGFFTSAEAKVANVAVQKFPEDFQKYYLRTMKALADGTCRPVTVGDAVVLRGALPVARAAGNSSLRPIEPKDLEGVHRTLVDDGLGRLEKLRAAPEEQLERARAKMEATAAVNLKRVQNANIVNIEHFLKNVEEEWRLCARDKLENDVKGYESGVLGPQHSKAGVNDLAASAVRACKATLAEAAGERDKVWLAKAKEPNLTDKIELIRSSVNEEVRSRLGSAARPAQELLAVQVHLGECEERGTKLAERKAHVRGALEYALRELFGGDVWAEFADEVQAIRAEINKALAQEEKRAEPQNCKTTIVNGETACHEWIHTGNRLTTALMRVMESSGLCDAEWYHCRAMAELFGAPPIPAGAKPCADGLTARGLSLLKGVVTFFWGVVLCTAGLSVFELVWD
eukprot:TRINITY_DN4534_c0_g1_i1.p1 TRINITY_DN4534_c0_g1~~TRINITY_DN4534_c0_g1_i1.p1  ORF type:complete len:650 (+),score=169.49 TRINITY_DN4534_c0_g1_i1:77-2026(+)